MSDPDRELIDYVQEVNSPQDELPIPAENDVWRPEVPDWVPRKVPRDGRLEPGEGLDLEPVASSEDDDWPEMENLFGPVEMFAYYLPFHFYHQRWGIYIRASGVVTIAQWLAGVELRGKLTRDLH